MNRTRSKFERIQPWVVVLSAALYFFFVFMQMNIFNAVGGHLQKDFGITSVQLGNLAASYFYSNVLLIFPAGLLLDRFSTRKIILIAMTVVVAATLWFAFSNHYLELLISRIIVGACGAFCLIASVRIAVRWFPANRMALVVGVIVTLAMLGAMLAVAPMTLLMDKFGWRETLVFDAIFGAVLLIPMFAFIKDEPEKALAHTAHSSAAMGFWQAIGKVIGNPQNWLGGLYVSLVNMPLMILGTTWGVRYLEQAHNIARAPASVMITVMFSGMLVGSTFVGFISDFFGRRKPPMIIGAIFSLGVILIIMFVGTISQFAMGVLFFTLGFASSFQVIGYPLVAESNSHELTGTAEGLASTLIMSGGFMVLLFPVLLNWHWSGKMINHHAVYSVFNYQVALAIIPVSFVIALITAILVRETRCQSIVQ